MRLKEQISWAMLREPISEFAETRHQHALSIYDCRLCHKPIKQNQSYRIYAFGAAHMPCLSSSHDAPTLSLFTYFIRLTSRVRRSYPPALTTLNVGPLRPAPPPPPAPRRRRRQRSEEHTSEL